MKKLKGIGTDGAATMTGVRNGVVTRLKAVSPSSIGVHCAAHRLNLAASQPGNAVFYVKSLISLFVRYLISLTTTVSEQLDCVRYKVFFRKKAS